MRPAILALSLATLLPACASHHTLNTPTPQHAISCGSLYGWSACYRKADNLCPSGYNVTNKHHASFGNNELTITCN